MKNSKRILEVVIETMADESPDTSHLGEYSNRPKSEFAIDRKHDTDCEAQAYNVSGYTILDHLFTDEECSCGGRGMDSREYRYFNPNYDNYKGLEPEEIRKYCIQDFERMESLNNGDWYYMGIRAKATIQLTGDLTQTINSGGVWGIESDSGDYLDEVAKEELHDLRQQLKAVGFSTRQISKAFKDVKQKG